MYIQRFYLCIVGRFCCWMYSDGSIKMTLSEPGSFDFPSPNFGMSSNDIQGQFSYIF